MSRKMWKEEAKLSETTFKTTKLIKNSTYTFRVYAINEIGESEPTELPEPFVAKDPFSKLYRIF